MATIYLIRHSAPFVEIENYQDYKNVSWAEYNKNMILSGEGEENAIPQFTSSGGKAII